MLPAMLRAATLILIGLPSWMAPREGTDDDPEAVLARAGLVKDGPAYILRDTRQRVEQAAALRRELEPVEARLERIESEERRLRGEVDDAEQSERRAENEGERREARSDRGAAQGELERFRSAVARESDSLERERERLHQALGDIAAEVEARYRNLWADPDVRAALREVNRSARPKFVLGPVANPAEYRARRRAMALGRLAEKGLVLAKKPPRLLIRSEADLSKPAADVRRRHDALQRAERGPAVESKAAELARRRKAVADRLAAEKSPARRRAVAAQLEALDGQRRRLEAAERDRPEDEGEARVAAARRDYIDAVRLLRRGVDAAAEDRRATEADAEVAALLEELRAELKMPLKLARPTELGAWLGLLRECERDAPPGAPLGDDSGR